MSKKIAVIGAGAAGCFCAIETKRRMPEAQVDVYEAATKPLAKVAVTGGGRCNLTNSFACCLDPKGRLTNLQTVYPRGNTLMRKVLGRFSHEDAWQWFESEGVRLVTQADDCVFPVSQDAMQIVGTLTRLMRQLGVRILLRSRVALIELLPDAGYRLMPSGEVYDNVVVTTGGSPREQGLSFLDRLSVERVPPVPSLFTFNIDGGHHSELMGTVVDGVTASLAGTKHKSRGPLLWTHWGVSGPAILRLSAYAARELAENGYQGTLVVNWCGEMNEEEVRRLLGSMMSRHDRKSVTNAWPEQLTQKHWCILLHECGIPQTQRWASLTATHINRLAAILTAQQLPVVGRSRWKEEFVTCGGVSLTSISPKTLEARQHPGLYFAGEVLDVDGITGGFNLQAAWSMAFTVARSLAS